jgi:hypothetical protein
MLYGMKVCTLNKTEFWSLHFIVTTRVLKKILHVYSNDTIKEFQDFSAFLLLIILLKHR